MKENKPDTTATTTARRHADSLPSNCRFLFSSDLILFLYWTVGKAASAAHTRGAVSLVIREDKRYLVAPYGEVSWVKNARAAGEVTLQRGKVTETLGFTELDPAAAGPILHIYYGNEAITRPYFDVPDNPSVADFVQDAPHHPVFLLNEA